jgi:preprotein translocase subunit SecG
MSILINLLMVLEAVVCLLLILLVLMQRPRQDGLGAAFGSGVMDQIAGAQTTNVLQKGTTWLGIALFSLAFVLAILISRQDDHSKTIKLVDEKDKAQAKVIGDIKKAVSDAQAAIPTDPAKAAEAVKAALDKEEAKPAPAPEVKPLEAPAKSPEAPAAHAAVTPAAVTPAPAATPTPAAPAPAPAAPEQPK